MTDDRIREEIEAARAEHRPIAIRTIRGVLIVGWVVSGSYNGRQFDLALGRCNLGQVVTLLIAEVMGAEVVRVSI